MFRYDDGKNDDYIGVESHSRESSFLWRNFRISSKSEMISYFMSKNITIFDELKLMIGNFIWISNKTRDFIDLFDEVL